MNAQSYFVSHFDKYLLYISESGESWLFGKHFTLGDVYLTILIERIETLGMSSRYYNANKNANVLRFRQQIGSRPSFHAIRKETKTYFLTLIVPKMLKKALPVLTGLAVVGAAVGLFVVWRSK